MRLWVSFCIFILTPVATPASPRSSRAAARSSRNPYENQRPPSPWRAENPDLLRTPSAPVLSRTKRFVPFVTGCTDAQRQQVQLSAREVPLMLAQARQRLYTLYEFLVNPGESTITDPEMASTYRTYSNMWDFELSREKRPSTQPYRWAPAQGVIALVQLCDLVRQNVMADDKEFICGTRWLEPVDGTTGKDIRESLPSSLRGTKALRLPPFSPSNKNSLLAYYDNLDGLRSTVVDLNPDRFSDVWNASKNFANAGDGGDNYYSQMNLYRPDASHPGLNIADLVGNHLTAAFLYSMVQQRSFLDMTDFPSYPAIEQPLLPFNANLGFENTFPDVVALATGKWTGNTETSESLRVRQLPEERNFQRLVDALREPEGGNGVPSISSVLSDPSVDPATIHAHIQGLIRGQSSAPTDPFRDPRGGLSPFNDLSLLGSQNPSSTDVSSIDPFGDEQTDQFGDPEVNPFDEQESDPFADQQIDPFDIQQSNPFEDQSSGISSWGESSDERDNEGVLTLEPSTDPVVRTSSHKVRPKADNFLYIVVALYLKDYDWSTGIQQPLAQALLAGKKI